jgi:hypothetical protein
MMWSIMDRMHPLPARCGSTAEALDCFDALPPLDLAALLGSWSGATFASGHPLDGALEAYGWHGKRMDGSEDVHPLVFATWAGRHALRPRPLAAGLPLLLRWPVLKSPPLAAVARAALPLLATRRSRARLRMVAFRGRVSAAMIYDDVPIQDVFRRVDQDTVLGLMDAKGMERPFFFVLRRERNSPTSP